MYCSLFVCFKRFVLPPATEAPSAKRHPVLLGWPVGEACQMCHFVLNAWKMIPIASTSRMSLRITDV